MKKILFLLLNSFVCIAATGCESKEKSTVDNPTSKSTEATSQTEIVQTGKLTFGEELTEHIELAIQRI